MIPSDSWKLVTSNSFSTKYKDLDISIVQNNNNTYTLLATYKLGDILFEYEKKNIPLILDTAKLEAQSLVASVYKDSPIVTPVTPVPPLRPSGIPTPPRPPRAI